MIYQLYLQSCAGSVMATPESAALSSDLVMRHKLPRDQRIEVGPLISGLIKEKKDTFIGIYTREQAPVVEKWIKDQGLDKYISYKAKKMVHNWNYPTQGPKLWIVVFNGKVTVNDKLN